MYEEFKARMARQGSYMGQAFKNQSDMIMDATFSRDPAYRICYLQEKDAIFPEQTLNGYKQAKAVYAGREVYDMDDIRGFERIEAKFLVHTYRSLSANDAEDYYLQFRPLAHGKNKNIRVGAYVFIPNDIGVYELWLIVANDSRPQFPQFYVLQCDFLAKWHIDEQDATRYEGMRVDTGSYFSWCVGRTQSSYNSGVWQDYVFQTPENQKKLWMPTNMDTNTINYNEHITISNNPLRRISWEVTKVMNDEPLGITKITLAQQASYDTRDNLSWVNTTTDELSDVDLGNAYDFYEPRTNNKAQHTKVLPLDTAEVEQIIGDENIITFSGVKPSLKIGGGYKTFTSDLNIAGKPYWRIHYVNNDTNICTVKFKYNDDELVCDNALKEFVVTDKTKISFGEQFGIQFKYNSEKPNELKIKCQSILNMLGGKVIIEAGNSQFTTYASLEVEVEGL